MPRPPNGNIGHIECRHCGTIGAIRKQKNGLLYWQCRCGKVTPNRQAGQDMILERGVIWQGGEPPADAPEWIRYGLPQPPFTDREPEPEPAPAEPEPIQEPEPVTIAELAEPEEEAETVGILGLI